MCVRGTYACVYVVCMLVWCYIYIYIYMPYNAWRPKEDGMGPVT